MRNVQNVSRDSRRQCGHHHSPWSPDSCRKARSSGGRHRRWYTRGHTSQHVSLPPLPQTCAPARKAETVGTEGGQGGSRRASLAGLGNGREGRTQHSSSSTSLDSSSAGSTGAGGGAAAAASLAAELAASRASVRAGELFGTHSSWLSASKTTRTCVAVSIRTHAGTPRTRTRSPTSKWASLVLWYLPMLDRIDVGCERRVPTTNPVLRVIGVERAPGTFRGHDDRLIVGRSRVRFLFITPASSAPRY